ncbi:hypothetical protein Tco_1090756 [Tanacetum coccineum]|uniref:Uncharacterized protein n=1 Tax=Tanacetum coccineum TaxID=301880 RepID=A0ABQ5I548_9ASTR
MRKWGRTVPTMDVVVESIVEAVGGDKRVLRVLSEGMKRNVGGVLEMEKVLKLERGVWYSLVARRCALENDPYHYPVEPTSVEQVVELYGGEPKKMEIQPLICRLKGEYSYFARYLCQFHVIELHQIWGY